MRHDDDYDDDDGDCDGDEMKANADVRCWLNTVFDWI